MSRPNSIIIEGIKRGDEKSLKELFDLYDGILVAFARQTVRNPLLAEDFVQDAFCTLWENRATLIADQSIQAYLFKLVYRRCVDYLRKQIVHDHFKEYAVTKLKELELMQNSLESHIIAEISAKEANNVITQTLEKLPDQTREIFYLSREQSLKNIEIAEKMGVSVKTIEYHISKTLHHLRESLRDFL
jgi:RNA polymerase sigma-70 factor, ECF subfamily